MELSVLTDRTRRVSLALLATFLVVAFAARHAHAQTLDPFPSQGVNLMSQVTLDEFSPDQITCEKVWGYTSPSGREYALFGTTLGTGFVEVTDPGRPRIVDLITGPATWHRVVRVYQDHAYVTSEDGPGIQVIDMSQIDSDIVTNVNTIDTGGLPYTHNLAIDETSGFLYRIGFWGVPGLRFYDLSDPANPVYAGFWDDEQVHDAQILTYTSGRFAGRQIAFSCTNTGADSLSIIDVTDKSNPVRIAEETYPNGGLAHQVWLTEDRKWAYLNDESDEANGGMPSTVYVFNVADIENPRYVTSFTNGNPAITWDNFVHGNRLFCSNVTSGLRVFDITNPLAPVETAWFDTWPSSDDASIFQGQKTSYPFFQSGVVIGGDDRAGLFVWTMDQPDLTFTFPGGPPEVLDPSGDVLVVRIDEETPGDLLPGTPELHFDDGTGPQSVSLVSLGGNQYQADLPSLTCGALVRYYVVAQSSNGFTWTSPAAATTRIERHLATAGMARLAIFADDFETDRGWTTSWQNPNSGFWERADPNGTTIAPEDDNTPGTGTMCWVTENGAPQAPQFDHDVTRGPYFLISPPIDLSGATDPYVEYARWFTNLGNSNHEDVFEVEIDDGSDNWVGVEVVGPTGPEAHGGWVLQRFRVLDHIPLGPSVRVRFIASDPAPSSGVEAAIDDFVVLESVCEVATIYCTGKTTSQGCVPFASAEGIPSLTDTNPFHLSAEDSVPGEAGLLLYGFSKSNLGFHGGKLCVKTPTRTAGKAAKSTAPVACVGPLTVGRLRTDFNNRVQSGIDPMLSIGQKVFTQWMQRDSANTIGGFSDSSTNGLRFTVLP